MDTEKTETSQPEVATPGTQETPKETPSEITEQ